MRARSYGKQAAIAVGIGVWLAACYAAAVVDFGSVPRREVYAAALREASVAVVDPAEPTDAAEPTQPAKPAAVTHQAVLVSSVVPPPAPAASTVSLDSPLSAVAITESAEHPEVGSTSRRHSEC